MQSTAVKREFCRRLFRLGGASATTRGAWLDALSDAAFKAKQAGKVLTATGSVGASAQFSIVEGWQPEDVISLVDEARDWAECSDGDMALDLIGDGPVNSYGHDFTSANATGGAL